MPRQGTSSAGERTHSPKDSRLFQDTKENSRTAHPFDPSDRRLRPCSEVRPSGLVLNAGVSAVMAPIHEQTWEDFSAPWHGDVKAGFHWIQEALKMLEG
jgi:hypothetical protein